jgi:hypothetical protein
MKPDAISVYFHWSVNLREAKTNSSWSRQVAIVAPEGPLRTFSTTGKSFYNHYNEFEISKDALHNALGHEDRTSIIVTVRKLVNIDILVLYPWYMARHNPTAIEDLTVSALLSWALSSVAVSPWMGDCRIECNRYANTNAIFSSTISIYHHREQIVTVDNLNFPAIGL